MKKFLVLTLATLATLTLAACAGTGGAGNTQAYGEIKGGVETVK